jgi:hypothetical protein
VSLHLSISSREPKAKADTYLDLSAISPFYIPTEQPTPLPDQCKLTQVSLLIRHSSILGNDDEFEETMEPFIKKIKKLQKGKNNKGKRGKKALPRKGDWAFLRDWKSPIVEETLENISEQGKTDATVSHLTLRPIFCGRSGIEGVKH